MICPNWKKNTLEKTNFYKNRIDRCSQCRGLWFDRDELRKAKDERDANLKWLDIDLWKENKRFRASSLKKLCPSCEQSLFEIEYGKSDVKVDVCDSCRGVWLDGGEFEKIIAYLKKTVDSETLARYFKHALKEVEEVFTGPEELSSEVKDFLLVSKLLLYRFYSQYPMIKNIITHLPFTR